MRTLVRSSAATLLVALAACGSPAAELHAPRTEPASASTAVPAAPADQPAPVLRTAALPPVDAGTVQGTVLGRFDDDGIETLEIGFAPPVPIEGWLETAVTVVDGAGGPLPSAFIASDRSEGGQGGRVLWIRRPVAQGGPVRATLAVQAFEERPGARFVVESAAPAMPLDPRRRAAFGEAFARHARERMAATPFAETAAGRVRGAYVAAAPGARPAVVGGDRQSSDVSSDLASLMRSTAGVGALSAALAHDRTLRLGPAGKRTLPIASVATPAMESHPWAAMAAKLPSPPAEPLALLVPDDVWYLRARSLAALFRVLDEADAWGTAAVRLAEDIAFDAGIAARYETQLGLRRSAMARAFGDSVVGEVALVGSDPYVREGTDLTVLFRVKSRPAFEVALADALAERARGAAGGVTSTSVKHGAHTIAIDTTADGAVRRHRATIGDVEVVSNSLGAVKRVLDAAGGKAPSLGKEADIRYVLARDAAEPHDVLALVGERLVRRVTGPAHKIGEARRQIARAELLAPGAAAVLHGWLRGAPPASADALVRTRLLDAKELEHGDDRQPIAFTPGRAPRSAWGTPGFMTPLVDLPAVDRVSPAERDAYGFFKSDYERGWAGEPFDPIVLRVRLPESGPMTAHLRVLPIPRDRDMDELLRVVGDGRVRADSAPSGARFVVSLSGDERWRQELGLPLGRLVGSRSDSKPLDWIGAWAAIGVADRNGLLHAARDEIAPEPRARETSPGTQRRGTSDEIESLAHLPLWMAVGVRSPATLGILLTVVRKLADDAMPGMVRWGEIGKEGSTSIVGVRIDGEALTGSAREAEIAVFYAMAPSVEGSGAAFYVSLKEDVLRGLLRDHAAGKGPRSFPAGEGDPRAAQALAEVAARDAGPIATLLVWAAEKSAREHAHTSRALAEWFFRSGAPAASTGDLAVAYLGAAPTTPSGKPFVLGPNGVSDPDRGDPAAPRWPALPVAGTPIAAVAAKLARVRVETSFDHEPASTRAAPLRSFVARMTIEPR